MFNKKSHDRLRESLERLEEEMEEREERENVTYTSNEVRSIVEKHVILGCRFGIYLLFQVQNQESVKDNIREAIKDKLDMDIEEMDDEDVLKVLMRNSDTLGNAVQDQMFNAFINDEHTNHAQAILVAHTRKEPADLVMASRAFSEQVDEYYEEHKDEAPLSASIN